MPVLVLIGGKEVQIDVEADGGPLRRAAAGRDDIEFVFPPEADHVLKHETHSRAEVLAGLGTPYNDEAAELDTDAMAAVLEWLGKTLG